MPQTGPRTGRPRTGRPHVCRPGGGACSPNEQLLQPLLDGAVCVGALAEVLDRVHAGLQRVPAAGHAREPLDDLHLVTVVQRARVPHQVAVAAVVPAGAEGKQWVGLSSPSPSARSGPPTPQRLSSQRQVAPFTGGRPPSPILPQRWEPASQGLDFGAALGRRVPDLVATGGKAGMVRAHRLQPANHQSPDFRDFGWAAVRAWTAVGGAGGAHLLVDGGGQGGGGRPRSGERG